MQLNLKEIDQLLEALQVWEKAPINEQFQDTLFGGLLGAMTAPKDPFERERHLKDFKSEEKRKAQLATDKAKQRKELSILIQAKLITERNRLLTEELSDSSSTE